MVRPPDQSRRPDLSFNYGDTAGPGEGMPDLCASRSEHRTTSRGAGGCGLGRLPLWEALLGPPAPTPHPIPPPPEPGSPSSDSSCESAKRPEKAQKEATVSAVPPHLAGVGPGKPPPCALREPGRNLSSPGITALTPPGRGAVGSEVTDSKGWVKGRGGTCQQVTEAPHRRLQLSRGGRVASHVLLVAEAQEPQLLHPARDRQTHWPTGPVVAALGFLCPPSCFRR